MIALTDVIFHRVPGVNQPRQRFNFVCPIFEEVYMYSCQSLSQPSWSLFTEPGFPFRKRHTLLLWERDRSTRYVKEGEILSRVRDSLPWDKKSGTLPTVIFRPLRSLLPLGSNLPSVSLPVSEVLLLSKRFYNFRGFVWTADQKEENENRDATVAPCTLSRQVRDTSLAKIRRTLHGWVIDGDRVSVSRPKRHKGWRWGGGAGR